MNKILTVNTERCIGCRVCLKSCPADEANIVSLTSDGNFITDINYEKCIACGVCINVCPRGARDYSDDTAAFMIHIKRNRAALIVSPAVKTAYPNEWKSVLGYFKKEGVGIFDGSFGADINIWATLRTIEQNKAGNIISANCPAVENYINMYKPSLSKYLSPVFDPETCEAVYLRSYLRRDGVIAVLSACTAKILEGTENDYIDYSITFDKVMEYFDRKHIQIEKSSSDDESLIFDDRLGQFGNVCFRPSGMKEILRLCSDKIQVCSSSGTDRIYRELDCYEEIAEEYRPRLFDVLSCKNGCVGGNSSNKAIFDPDIYSSDIINEYLKKKKSNVLRINDDKLFKKFDEILSPDSFLRIRNAPNEIYPVSEEKLENIYCMMGKQEQNDRSFNCGFCGYDTCYKLAAAIYHGLNVPESCIMSTKTSAKLSSKNSEITERLETVAAECRSHSDLLFNNIVSLREKIGIISKANSEIGEMSSAIITLLDNVINLARKKDYIDENALASLINVLEKISSGLHMLETNIKNTYKSSEDIESVISELTSLSEELNVTVYDAGSADKYSEY